MLKNFCIIIIVLTSIGCSNESNKDPIGLATSESILLSDDQLLDLVQKQTLKYFWDLAEPNSGMARERYHVDEPSLDEFVVTTGGTGFGVMAILTGINRGFIEREEAFYRLKRIVDFLESAPRFHGAWSHWLNGKTGEVVPFGEVDNGGDLVETALLIQGLLCVRQYFINGNFEEQELAQKIDKLWHEVDWNFYRGAKKEPVLFWHWSPDFGWKINFRIRGYNETLITYILAASSPTFPIPAEVYHKGWADGGKIKQQNEDKPLPLFHQGDEDLGGPLFWAHYSYLGLDPRNLKDQYADYWEHNVAHTLLNYQHCIANPNNYKGYSNKCWGLTASYSMDFYAAHSPKNDLGVITPTAALSSFPYTPESSMQALRHFYQDLGKNIWGPYGFYDAFSIHNDWYPHKYLAIDQGPIIVMIENYRSNLLWDLFMSSPEIRKGLDSLGFKHS